ncbi:MAG: prepilin-type N-terminal cleavage/methylation domain-containing protein [Desulfatibacillum sp.]|nr:prepilin-type N-terminal cleavage/methylation domain-containing protein [Desulfatibacillum sp.]
MKENSLAQQIKKRLADSQGFYLIEVLVAMAILSVGVLAAAQMQTNSMGTNTAVSKRGVAMLVAQSQLEIISGRKYSVLAGLISEETVTADHMDFIVKISCPGGARQITLDGIPANPAKDPWARDMILDITFQNKGKTETMTFITTRTSADSKEN